MEYVMYEGKRVRKSGKGPYVPRPTKRGKIPWNKGLPNPIVAERNRVNNPAKYGTENNKWKGGITKPEKRLRTSKEARAWTKAVLKRDGKCVWCGSEYKLQADHIKPWAYFPEHRFDIENGRALCAECHKRSMFFCRNCSEEMRPL